jgi:hypothetical protein
VKTIVEKYEECIAAMRAVEDLPAMTVEHRPEVGVILTTDGTSRHFILSRWTVPEKDAREAWMAGFQARLNRAERKGLS